MVVRLPVFKICTQKSIELSQVRTRNSVTHLVRGLLVSGYDPYTLRYFSLWPLSLGFSQTCLLIPLAGAKSGISKHQTFLAYW